MTLILNGTDNSATTPAVTGTDTDTGIYYPSANEVAIATAGTQKAYVGEFAYLTSVSASNASLTLKKGAVGADAVDFLQMRDSSNNADFVVTGAGNISLFGGQITFPATQSASSDANTLDDYEEGTWTPLLSGATFTYGNNIGTYEKIGKMVHVSTFITLSSISSATATSINITGLPFTSMSSIAIYGLQACQIDNLTVNSNGVGVQVNPNATNATLLGGVGTTGSHYGIPGNTLTTNTNIRLNAVYQAAS